VCFYWNVCRPKECCVSVPVQQTAQLVAVLTKQTESGTSEVEVQVLGDEAALLEATGLTLSEDGQLTQVMHIVCSLPPKSV
jgi:hypothetical protein